MTRESDSALGRALFEAARRDRAPEALRRVLRERAQLSRAQLSRAQPSRAQLSRAQLSRAQPVPPERAVPQPRAIGLWTWLSAAALLSAAAGWWGVHTATEPAPSITAEHVAPRPGPEGTESARAVQELPARLGRERDEAPHSVPADERKSKAPTPRRSPAAVPKPPAATAPAAASDSDSVVSPAAAAATPSATVAAPASAPPSFSTQLSILERARAELRAGDSTRALDLLAPYASELRGTTLEAEATLLRIDALSLAGREPEARALAEQFLLRYPNSPLTERARRYVSPARPLRTP